MDDVDIRVRLRGGRVVQAEAQGVAAAIDNIGDQATQASSKLASLRASTAGLHGPMSALGSASRTAGLYLGGAAVAAAGFGTFMGLKFNATMEQNVVAFRNFTGSAKSARRELDFLFELNKKTPFEMPEITDAARRFLSFGYSVKQANDLLVTTADSVAAIGGGAAEFQRLSMVFGQIKAKGKVQTEELLQFAELGLPAFQILREQLHLTKDELADLLQSGSLQAGPAIKALKKGLDKQFGGMAEAQSKTFSGQLSTLKDNMNQTLGELTLPLFEKLRDDVFPWLNSNMPGIAKAMKRGMDLARKGFEAVKGVAIDFLHALEPAKPFWDNVLGPLLKGFAIGIAVSIVGALKVAIPLFKGFMVVLGFIGRLLAPLKGVFQGIGTALGFVLAGPVLKGVSLLGKLGGVFRVVGVVARALSIPIRVLGRAFGAVVGAVGRVMGAFKGLFGYVLPSIRGTFSKVLGFVTGLGGKFFSAGKGLVSKLVQGVKGIGGAIVRAFGSGLGFAADIGRALADWLNRTTPLGDHVKLPGPLPDFTMPALASGGIVTSGGAVLVGERGPEVLRLSKGARVDPLPRGAVAMGGSDGERTTVVPVYLDGRVLTEVVHKHTRNASNRR